MTDESAARYQLGAEPRLSLDNLGSLRAEIDALLSFLQSDARMEHANNEAQERKRSAGPVRTEQAGRLAGPLHKEHLAALVKTLLLEIAAALASGKVANDQDHG